MNLKILREYELDTKLVENLKEICTPFANRRGESYKGWLFCCDKPSVGRSAAAYKNNGTVEFISSGEANVGIRAIVNYSEIKNQCKITKNLGNGYMEVEYGEYPQFHAELEMQEKLDQDLLNKELVSTGKKYTIYNSKENKTVKLIEVVDKKGNKYVNNNNIWYVVSPVTWIVSDQGYGNAISKYMVAGGVPFGDVFPTRYHYEYMLKSPSNIYGFLKALAKDLVPSCPKKELEPEWIYRPEKWQPPIMPCDPIPGRNPLQPHNPEWPIPSKPFDPWPPVNPFLPQRPRIIDLDLNSDKELDSEQTKTSSKVKLIK